MGPEEVGFLAYGPRIVQLYRDVMAPQLVQLLRGARRESAAPFTYGLLNPPRLRQ
jgi:hypothetical protein